MASFSEQMEEHALDLAWNLWAELGVSGWRRIHISGAIDPEQLILFTAFLEDADPRLRDESSDWCIAYGRYVSAARLKNLLAKETPAVQEAFGETAATINANSSLRWPGATQARAFRRSRRSAVADFGAPALVLLRLRALFGVGARAEIIRAFVTDPAAKLTAADLAGEAGYTKRNISDALEALGMAGLLDVTRLRNQLVYGLSSADWPLGLPGDLPSSFPRWESIFRIFEWLLVMARRSRSLTARARAVEASDVLHAIEADLRSVGTEMPMSGVRGNDPWGELEQWALSLTEAWASSAFDA